MLADRDYMREPESRWPTATTVLLVVLGLCFAVQAAAALIFRTDLIQLGGLSRDGFAAGKVWQLLSFQFLHAFPAPWHLLGNGLVIYFFGRSVETALGARRFLALYFTGGVLGGLLQLLMDWLMQADPAVPLVGASAGASTFIAIFCRLYPEREGVFVIYFFPITLRAQQFLWAVLAMSGLGTFLRWSNVAEAAHLGGLLFGIAWVSAVSEEGRLRGLWEQLGARFRPRAPAPVLTPRFKATRIPRAEQIVEADDSDYIAREVDPILEKIAAHGMQSLTDRERKILATARDRMAKR